MTCIAALALQLLSKTTDAHAAIFSREWWITVFLVGLAIHLLASYLKPHLDQIGGWFSRAWTNRNEARAKARQERVDTLKRSRRAKANATTEELRARLSGLQWMAFSTVFLVVFVTSPSPHHRWDNIAILIITIFVLVSGANAFSKGNDIHIDMLEAEEQQREAQKNRIEAEMEETLSQLGLPDDNGDPKGPSDSTSLRGRVG